VPGDGAARTERATPRRRQELLRQGRVPRSLDARHGVLALGGLGLIWVLWSALVSRLVLFQQVARDAASARAVPSASSAVILLPALGPILFAPAALAILVNIVIIGRPIFALGVVRPDFSRLDPRSGLQRMVSLAGMIEIAKALVRIGAAIVIVASGFDALARASALAGLTAITGRLVIFCAAIGLLGAADLLYQRWRYERDIRMTRQELLEEQRSSEGDPRVRRALRQRMMSRGGGIHRVREATVVIANPTHIAVAILYQPGKTRAPVVIARGEDEWALRILDAAAQASVPIVRNPPLARDLYANVPLDAEIPTRLYRALAMVLAEVYRAVRAARKTPSASSAPMPAP
jgi:flagellar biosynthetic protein FlhB